MAQPRNATQETGKRTLCAKWSRGTKSPCWMASGAVGPWVESIERFSYDFEMKTREKNRRNKRTENRAIWLVYRTDTNARGFWLAKWTLGWKNFKLENFLEINRYIALTSYCNTIGQSNKAFSISGFSLAGKKPCFDLFIISCLNDVTSLFFLPLYLVCHPARCFLYYVIVTVSRVKRP